MGKLHPPVVVVDEHDNVVGAAPMREVWQKGLWHRIVRIMVGDDTGRILLQKRSRHMDLYPGCWDHSASGHVDEGDTYEKAAKRELQEELGLGTNLPLTERAYYQTTGSFDGRQLNRFNKLYTLIVPRGQQFAVEEYEVSEVRWFSLGEAKKLVADHPKKVTEGLAKVIQEYY